uniref:Integrase, catalytic region, zinc finger, CCHC-type, peptidase aspartic, catalytic n=1 Tax=Tanacetum cinerariifolium TaxID=118510 RepID=A0A699IGJ0_TANCI|nr:integrase, catalytic region, zinc finger, CCHC-type, peptidase aspartic, catalytic [Tanacetum cinerariifolium]
MEYQKSCTKHTQTINDLNQTISEIKDKLSAHQETIFILSQQKEAQIKLYKTRKDKELKKVIALENKVKVLDNIVYKTGQSVQTMNILNNKCRTRFAKPEFLKKAQRANPRLYDIRCYNDNLALMFSHESDEVIHLEKESRSKLSDLIRPFDYNKLKNLYDLFVPQREKSSEQRYFSKRSRFSHTSINNGNSKQSFNKQTTLLEKLMDESIPLDKKCQSSIEIFKVKTYVNAIFNGVELCKEKIANRTYFGYIDPFIQKTIEAKFSPEIRRINVGLAEFHKCLNVEMVADLRYFNSLELEVESLRSQLETQKTQFLNEIDRLSREYYYTDHMNAIFGMHKVHTKSNQARTSQLTQDSRKTNKRVSFSTGVIPITSVSRPQLKSNPMGDSILHNNSYGKKQDVEDHYRSVKFSKNKTSVTACNDSLNAKTLNVNSLVEIVLFIVDSGCSKHMKGNLKLLINFVEKFLGTVKFGNDQIAPILGYRDLIQGAVTIKRVYYVEGLNHNLFFVGQFCDADLEVAFRKSTCYIRDLKGNDLLTNCRGTDLYLITLQDTNYPNPICLMAKASSSQAWLWHRRLSYLNFDTINLLSKNNIVVGLPKSKDETPEVLINFLRLIQRGLQDQVRIIQTDKGIEFLNQTLYAYFVAEWILHQTSVARTPEKNGVVGRRNRTLVEVARTMLSVAKVPLFFWPEAIATACFTQNRSLVIPRHEKTPYHIINDRKPSVKFFYIFGSICYIVRDGENLDKIKEKGDEYIFVEYSTQSRAYIVFNKRTKVIMESFHVNFDKLPHMASDHISSDPEPECQRMALEYVSLSPAIQRQANVPQTDKTVTTSNELDLLFSLMFDELLNGSFNVVSKSFAVSSADAPNQRQHYTTPLNNHTTPVSTCQVPTLAPTVTSSENINQADMYAENNQVANDEFINIFCTPVQN